MGKVRGIGGGGFEAAAESLNLCFCTSSWPWLAGSLVGSLVMLLRCDRMHVIVVCLMCV